MTLSELPTLVRVIYSHTTTLLVFRSAAKKNESVRSRPQQLAHHHYPPFALRYSPAPLRLPPSSALRTPAHGAEAAPAAAASSPVDLTENNVLGADDGDDVREHVALGHEVQPLQVREARGLDLAAVRLVRTVADCGRGAPPRR